MKTLVLMYHNVVSSSKDLHLYDVSLKAFREQMVYLRDTHDAVRDTILTFDDGYKSWAHEVLDILNEAGLKAYFFICIEFIKKGSISKEDIIRLKDNGMVIGSHGMKHRFLHGLSDRELFYELGESKKLLEDIVRDKIRYFSVPRGMHNRRILKIAKDLGYERIFTSEIGINDNSVFSLKRISVKRNTGPSAFVDILSGKNIRKMRFEQRIKNFSKKVIGIHSYNRLRRIMIRNSE